MLTFYRKSTFPIRYKKAQRLRHYAPPGLKSHLITIMWQRITAQERIFHYKVKEI